MVVTKDPHRTLPASLFLVMKRKSELINFLCPPSTFPLWVRGRLPIHPIHIFHSNSRHRHGRAGSLDAEEVEKPPPTCRLGHLAVNVVLVATVVAQLQSLLDVLIGRRPRPRGLQRRQRVQQEADDAVGQDRGLGRRPPQECKVQQGSRVHGE